MEYWSIENKVLRARILYFELKCIVISFDCNIQFELICQ
jgi:hypothetical protein